MNADPFREMIRRNNWLVLDTETTGLKAPAEIVQIAIIDWAGQTKLDTFIRPQRAIPRDASAIHGITLDMLKDSPEWSTVRRDVIDIIQNRDVVIYNATYDRYMIHCSDKASGLPKFEYKSIARFHCAMEWYAPYWGEYDDWHGSYRWQRLTKACVQQGVEVSNAHNALGDCLMTRALILKVMEKMARADLMQQIGGSIDE